MNTNKEIELLQALEAARKELAEARLAKEWGSANRTIAQQKPRNLRYAKAFKAEMTAWTRCLQAGVIKTESISI